MSFRMHVGQEPAEVRWCTMSFSCPVALRDQIARLADDIGWSRAKFLYRLLDQVVPQVEIVLPDAMEGFTVSDPSGGEDK